MGVPGYIYKSYTFLPILDVNQPLYFTKFYIGFRTTSKYFKRLYSDLYLRRKRGYLRYVTGGRLQLYYTLTF